MSREIHKVILLGFGIAICLILIHQSFAEASSDPVSVTPTEKKKTDQQVCEDHRKMFLQNLSRDPRTGAVKYSFDRNGISATPDWCAPITSDCSSDFALKLDKTNNTLTLSQKGKALLTTTASPGRLKGVVSTDLQKPATYAETPNGNYTLGSPEDYRCSQEFKGSGMNFAIPIRGSAGLYLHGIDDKRYKEVDVIDAIPASAGCVRLVDNIACQLYATIKRCYRRKFSFTVTGQYPLDGSRMVRDSSGDLVTPEARADALAKANARRLETLSRARTAP